MKPVWRNVPLMIWEVGRIEFEILIVGDTVDPQLYDHFRRDRFPDSIDAILSVGDLPPWYLSYLTSVFNAPLYYVRGIMMITLTTILQNAATIFMAR